MSRDTRDWQKDMELCERALRKEGWSIRDIIAEQPQMSMYWLNEVKQLKEDNTRLTCQYTGAEQKYLTQSNVIADLRNELEQIKSTAEIKYIQHAREKHEKETTLLLEHISRAEALTEVARNASLEWQNVANQYRKAEEREQKLKEAIEERLPGMLPVSRELMKRTLATLYPLDREDTK